MCEPVTSNVPVGKVSSPGLILQVTVPVLLDPSPQLILATYCSWQLTSVYTLLPVSVNVATSTLPVLLPSCTVTAVPLSGVTVIVSAADPNATPLWSTASAEAVAAAIPT